MCMDIHDDKTLRSHGHGKDLALILSLSCLNRDSIHSGSNNDLQMGERTPLQIVFFWGVILYIV
jgi:hypothetical protein